MASRHSRKTQRGVIDHEALLDAIKSVNINKVSMRTAAAVNNLKLTSFHRHVAKFNAEVPDISAVPNDQLLEIVRRIGSYSNTGLAHSVCYFYILSFFLKFLFL